MLVTSVGKFGAQQHPFLSSPSIGLSESFMTRFGSAASGMDEVV